MTRFQVLVIALCVIMNVIEGYDILVMGFAASGVRAEWGVSASAVGLLISAGLMGMAVGSTLVAPLADRIGRRPLTLVCLAVATLGMALSAATGAYGQLWACRFVTGLGVGGVMVSLPVIIAEFSSRRARGTSVAFFALGLPTGGLLGGSVAALVASHYGWRATFVSGAILSFVTAAAMLKLLPESLDFLLTRRPRGALVRVNRLLERLRLERVTELPEPAAHEVGNVRAAVLTGRNGVRSALLWLGFFALFGALYFASNWMPQLLEQSGLSARQGIGGGIMINLGGIVGSLLMTLIALRFSSRVLAVVTLAGAAVVFLAMAFVLGNLTATLVVAVVMGMLLYALGASLYALGPALYPTGVRSTALGWAVGVGRIGAIVTPLIAGVLVDAGWSGVGLFELFAIPLALAALGMVALRFVKPAPVTQPAPVSGAEQAPTSA
ncbi:MFS transporter [Amycolatopsis rhabdoformis]|uniref:MFS transporter n=1 Tax=Amycolatopsis rhabdoformis TaxID=1448059 RepID=A0ABZ1HXR2_9PSEU|nr:MFS transporter [Amycolatopsis rhabdoformis]WSE26306.1 MFS transporter [Amycolatopsis rhabdoformis]